MRKILLAIFAIALLTGFSFKNAGCATVPKQTVLKAGKVSVSHSADVKDAPQLRSDTDTHTIPVPAGSKLIVKKVEQVAATENHDVIPAYTETSIELPKSVGTEITTVDEKIAITGSAGYRPAAGPTPTEKANSWWTYIGIAMAALGGFFCTPWGGSNYRVGAIIAGSGIGMAVVGKFIDQIKITAPSLFLFGIILALGVYYGYRVRHKQIETEPTPTAKPAQQNVA